jgi:hypothetical protein
VGTQNEFHKWPSLIIDRSFCFELVELKFLSLIYQHYLILNDDRFTKNSQPKVLRRTIAYSVLFVCHSIVCNQIKFC